MTASAASSTSTNMPPDLPGRHSRQLQDCSCIPTRPASCTARTVRGGRRRGVRSAGPRQRLCLPCAGHGADGAGTACRRLPDAGPLGPGCRRWQAMERVGAGGLRDRRSPPSAAANSSWFLLPGPSPPAARAGAGRARHRPGPEEPGPCADAPARADGRRHGPAPEHPPSGPCPVPRRPCRPPGRARGTDRARPRSSSPTRP